MRILHLFKTYLPESFTGIERVIWEIAEGLAPLGVETDVLALAGEPSREPFAAGHHTVHHARRDLYLASTGLSLSLFGKFRALAARADIVHYHFPWPMMDLLHLVQRPACPTLVTYHSDIVRQRLLAPFYQPLMHRFLQGVDHIVATSPAYAETSRVLTRYGKKISIVPIGLAERQSPPAKTDVAAWRQRVGADFFLFVGALRYYKGLPFLLDAAERTGLPLVIAGEGEIRPEIEARNLANVRLLGSVSDADKEALLALCRAFVFPSHLRSEAFGVALVEAARAGKPMISCEIGTGTSYVNVDRETGLTVPPADPEALAAAMRRLAGDQEAARQMGRNARIRYEKLFRAETMCAAYLDLYRALARGKV
ncbi:glycosyltransferase [Chelativorans sp. Marseille-P2723]|uniref:glycosyltransferase n=1 Tax=Chelativorans sp. Marseille-P2723 TaxID=2709133 RepID=UPI0015701760|nr:glycosyltransferase [Chelativorans sp. Marseille-P2723]